MPVACIFEFAHMWTIETRKHSRRRVQTQNILSWIVAVQPCRQRRGDGDSSAAVLRYISGFAWPAEKNY